MINIIIENDFILGEVFVYPSRNQLVADGKAITLQPKVMAVFAYLARHHERVVSSEELMEVLWKGRIVTQGSVQKSINSLRKGLAGFWGDEEVIRHYSKRGYQLTRTPVFIDSASGLPGPVAVGQAEAKQKSATSSEVRGRFLWVGLALLVTGLLLILLLNPADKASVQEAKNHKIRFSSVSEYTHLVGHARDAEPHPDNHHVAYIREQLNGQDRWEINSELMIRNNKGEDWQIANSQGSWVALAWSPSGQHLVAIEIWRQEGLPSTPNFFERPNYLYTFHIFSLDLQNSRLLEKHLLSQWQGRINSVTWWDENTLEFVASQGPDSSFERYRYSVSGQQLTNEESTRALANPLMTAVMNKRTALASSQKNRIKIDLIDEQQISRASWLLDYSQVDMSWIPDGSGILVFAEEQQKLLTLYWDGGRQDIALDQKLDRPISRPRFRPDGAAIYYTEERQHAAIWLLDAQQTRTKLSAHSELNHIVEFSPAGDRIVYATVRDNQMQLWLKDGQGERSLSSQPLTQNISHLLWTADEQHIIYKAGRQIIFHNLVSGAENILRLEASDIEPLAFDGESGLLFVTRSSSATTNIWTIHTQSLEQKQLTFGAVGSVRAYAGDIYFQYRGKQGLWVLHKNDLKLTRVVDNLEENSRILYVDGDGVYFITGGNCRESDIYYLDFSAHPRSVFLARDKKIVSTHSFHPQAGVLQSDCVLAESGIFLLE